MDSKVVRVLLKVFMIVSPIPIAFFVAVSGITWLGLSGPALGVLSYFLGLAIAYVSSEVVVKQFNGD